MRGHIFERLQEQLKNIRLLRFKNIDEYIRDILKGVEVELDFRVTRFKMIPDASVLPDRVCYVTVEVSWCHNEGGYVNPKMTLSGEYSPDSLPCEYQLTDDEKDTLCMWTYEVMLGNPDK